MHTTYARATCRSKRTNTYFKVCPYCGAKLDPNEKCDCKENVNMAEPKTHESPKQ